MIQNIKGKRVPLFFRQTEFLSPFFFLISFPLFLYTERLKLITNYTCIVMLIYLILCSKEFKNHLVFSPPRPMIAGKQSQSRSGNARIIGEKKGRRWGKKEKKNLMDACTHDRDRASSARETGGAIRYPGNRCPGPVVA